MSNTDELDSSLLSALSSVGLEVVSPAQLHHISSQQIISAVAHYDAKPKFTVPIASADALDELDRLWISEAHDIGLYSGDGEILLRLPGPGSSQQQLLHVRDSIQEHLPSRIAEVTGSAEFDAISLDENTLCSISEEEYDFWVISLTLNQKTDSIPQSETVDHKDLCDFIAAGGSFQETISHIRSSGVVPIQKMHVMRLLHDQCGIPSDSLRLIFSMVDQNCIALNSNIEIEKTWQRVLHNQEDDAPKA
ncbi:hypothetical protein [Nocardia sp. CC201C]|uniref:hypothetical protein n=1 Tax=Nocardia sp. CC201C TaxID=3044575 RepID=UPI0024A86185|nr:hypothetical protein [Nocardia sp. CC201C]